MTFDITLLDPQGGSHRLQARPGETVLDAAMRHGLHIPYGCRNGTCGTCRARIVEGRISYTGGRPPGLSEAEAAAGQALLCSTRPESDLVVAPERVAILPEGLQPARRPARVTALERLSHDVMAVRLRLPAGQRLRFLPGQYLDVLLRDGRRRSFSMASAPHAADDIELHVRRVDGGRFTNHVFEELREKTILRVEGPLGEFYLREASPRPLLLMGGGTGFAPLKAILEHAFHYGIDRPMHLYWGVRARRDLYMMSLLQHWQAEHSHFRFTPVLSEPGPEDAWDGRTGWVHEALIADYPDLSPYDVYMSGPPAMVDAAQAIFPARGLPVEQLFFDSFDYARDDPQVDGDD